MLDNKEGLVLGNRVSLLVSLLALYVFVATTEQRAEATDVAPVEGELRDVRPTGTSIFNDPMYQNSQALKSLNSAAIAAESRTCNNDLNGERIVTCGGPVVCSGNTDVGTK